MDLLSRGTKTQAIRAPNIIVHVPLDQPNVNFNFAALAEEKYGWDALHPIAARLRAINKLESDDESDSEAPDPESASTQQPGTNGSSTTRQVNGDHSGSEQRQKKKRKRRRDLEYYDISDPFIDDDELVLQERTVASKDGFFVFQGPLVAEGEKVRIEKADGTQKRTAGKSSRAGAGKGRARAASSNAKTARPKTAGVKSDDEASSASGPVTKKTATTTKKDLVSEAAPSNVEDPQASTVVSPLPTQIDADQKDIIITDAMEVDSPEKASQAEAPKLLSPVPVAEKAKKSARPKVSTPKASNGAIPALVVAAGTSVPPSTPEAKVVKKRAPSTAASQKRAETGVNAPVLDVTAPASNSNPPAGTGTPEAANKKPRKPTREKTVEEKAELARKAREARERKKLEKKALEDAILARAIANPAIDTSGITAPSTPTPVMIGQSTPIMETQTTQPAPSKTAVTNSSAQEAKATQSPSGRSMSLGALID